MKNILYFLLLNFCLCSGKLSADADIRALVLIVASDDDPVYPGLQQSWRSYMHSDPEHIEAYFIRANPNLPSKVEVIGDTIWCQTPDGFHWENNGIIMKTLFALEHVLPNLSNRFDFVMRTNLSTFCVFPRFLDYLKTLPKTGCFAGPDVRGALLSGTGLIFSPDIVELLATNQEEILSTSHNLEEDLCLSNFLRSRGVPMTPHKFLVCLGNISEWPNVRDTLPSDVFQIRPKTVNRVPDDLTIHSELFRMFY